MTVREDRVRSTTPVPPAAVRACGIAVPAALAAVAAIHAAWALGWRWPGGTDQRFAERVLDAQELPPIAAVWAVVLALLVAAGIVRAAAVGVRHRLIRLAVWGVAAVLLGRAVMGLPGYLADGVDRVYAELDLAVYAPLCLLLAAGTAVVALGTRRS
jgi:hypothetical protein